MGLSCEVIGSWSVVIGDIISRDMYIVILNHDTFAAFRSDEPLHRSPEMSSVVVLLEIGSTVEARANCVCSPVGRRWDLQAREKRARKDYLLSLLFFRAERASLLFCRPQLTKPSFSLQIAGAALSAN